MGKWKDRLQHAWNAFVNLDKQELYESYAAYGSRPDRTRLRYTNEKTIIAAIYTRLAIDVSELVIKHVRLDDQGRFESEIKSGLNECLNLQANVDQAARHFRMDVALSLFDEGVIAVVPVDTTMNPNLTGGFDIKTMRVGRIVQWHPQHIRVEVYNEQNGRREEVALSKEFVAIVENPFYPIMNEPNSTLQRLIRKLHLLDAVDEQSSSGKLDLIIQLPYSTKSDVRRKQAEQRRTDIEFQLKGSQYGIAYIDGTEKVTQLNRPSENNLLKQVEYLEALLYSQLGISKKVMDGTADQPEMQNYYNRTVKPIVQAIVEAMRRSFLTKTARTQGQSIEYFRDPFALIPVDQLAEIADKFTRNEILTSNEIRTAIGFIPSKEKKADKLDNANMPDDKRGNGPQPALEPRAPQRAIEPPPERLRSAS
jgi:hypothetical protein